MPPLVLNILPWACHYWAITVGNLLCSRLLIRICLCSHHCTVSRLLHCLYWPITIQCLQGRRKGPPRPPTGGGAPNLGAAPHNFTSTWNILGFYYLAGVLCRGSLKGSGVIPRPLSTALSVTLRELEERLGISISTIDSIITVHLNMSRVVLRWVHKLLSDSKSLNVFMFLASLYENGIRTRGSLTVYWLETRRGYILRAGNKFSNYPMKEEAWINPY